MSNPLPVNLTKNNIEGSYNRHYIGHQVANAHLFQCLKINQRRWAHAHAPGLSRAIRNQIATNLALGTFYRVVVVADRQLNYFWQFCVHWTIRQIVQGLIDNAPRLSHLFEPNEIAIVGVAVFSERNVKVHIGISRIGSGLANIPGDSRSTKSWT